jgi:hypothetical protein
MMRCYIDNDGGLEIWGNYWIIDLVN